MPVAMQLGIHVVRRAALGTLIERGALPAIPEPWLGVLDLVRALEGHAPEPRAHTPLGVVGLDALLRATGSGDRDDAMRMVRRGLHEARSYFEWRQIPLCFLMAGRVRAAGDGVSLELELDQGWCSLTALLGRSVRPMGTDAATGSKVGKLGGQRGRGADWWWAPQLG